LELLPLALEDGLKLKVDMVGLKEVWSRQPLDCLSEFSVLMGQGEVIYP
jgi:hypothetical protein